MIFDVDTQLGLTPLALTKARERAHLSQEEVVVRCPISLPCIQNYERPGCNPQYWYLLTLLNAYGLDLGGFYELLREVYADEQRAAVEERLDRVEERLGRFENAPAKTDAMAG